MRVALAMALAATGIAPDASDTTCSVALKKQISGTKCVHATNFGCNAGKTSMWIKGGCRGTFSCDSKPTECWSIDRATTTECACDGSPFKPPTPGPHPGPPSPPSSAPAPFVPMDAPNMNGAYARSETGTELGERQKVKEFKDYPGGARYFDVYTPVFSTLYSQVFWTALAPVDIPQDVIDRYANGGVMAMVSTEATSSSCLRFQEDF